MRIGGMRGRLSAYLVRAFLEAMGGEFNGIRATGGTIHERYAHRGKTRRYNFRHGIK